MANAKMKTKSGAKKRFKLKPNGQVKRYRAYRGHLKTKKSPDRNRRLRMPTAVKPSDLKAVKSLFSTK